MKPIVAVDITARDKTEAGQKAAERRFGKFARNTGSMSREAGLGKLGQQLEGLTKFKKLSFGFEDAGRSLSSIGRMSTDTGGKVRAMTENMLSFGGVAEGALGGVAETAGVAAGAVAGVTAAVVGLGVATYALGDKWAKTGAEIGRTAKTLSVSADFLQRARAANERYGVSPDQTTAALDAFGSTLYDARSGANNRALYGLDQLGVKLKTTKDGAIDVAAAYDDVSDAIARQKDPLVQRQIASIYGLTGALPAIREGSAKLKTEGSDYAGSGAELSDSQVAQSQDVNRKTVALRQHLSALEKKAGMAAMSATGGAADAFLGQPGTPSRAVTVITEGATALMHGGAEAGRALVAGGREAAHEIAGAVRGAIKDPAAAASAFFRGMGFTGPQAQGMAAGAYAESRLDPNAVNPKSGAFGLGQWLGKRKAELFKRYGAHPTFEQQLEFMGWELTHAEAPAAHAIGQTSSATDAMEAYIRRFERPKAGDETQGDIRRGGNFLASADRAPAGKTQVEITLRGAPPGTVAKVSPAPDANVNLNVARSLDGF